MLGPTCTRSQSFWDITILLGAFHQLCLIRSSLLEHKRLAYHSAHARNADDDALTPAELATSKAAKQIAAEDMEGVVIYL